MSIVEVIPHDRTHKVTKELQTHVRVYFTLAGAITCAILYAIATDGVLVSAIALLIGFFCGMLLVWREHLDAIVARMNTYGIAYLAGYALFQLGGQYAGPGAIGTAIAAALYTFIGAALLGRGYRMRRALIEALEENPELHRATK